MRAIDQTIRKGETLRLKEGRLERIKKVRRAIAAVEDRDLTDVGLLDEMILEGLKLREERKDLQPFLKNP